ncbi:MAG: FHA domain-containing protein, partial [Myxococcota bacterium]|nr:FHA domain-containing protein [Myxococcota bacterium]
VIGRGEDCDIIIDHRSVSQNHAKIVRDKTANYQIIDLNSKNGVRISGDKYTSTHLKRGDIVELGHVKFRFVEPGENYVFTPQSIIDDEPMPSSSATPSAGGRNPLVIGGVIGIILLIAVVAIGATVMSNDGEKKENNANNTTASVNTTETEPKETTPKETTPESFSNEKIAEGIAAARTRLEEGDVDKAVGILEGLEYANPSASDKEAIGNLISKARKERPFQKDFIIVKDNLEKENFLEALRALKNIPSHSLFYKLLEDNGQRGKILTGVLDDADAAIADNDRARAKTLIDEVLAFDPENEDAIALQEKLAAKVASNNSKPPKTDDPPKNDKKVVKKDPKPPKLSKEEAKELRIQANKKVIAGNYGEGISDCKKALRAGESDCHRIMAIAYMKQGKNKEACSSFQKAINTNPVNKSILERYRRDLGCE